MNERPFPRSAIVSRGRIIAAWWGAVLCFEAGFGGPSGLAQGTPPALQAALHPGVTIVGTVGERYRIDYRLDVEGPETWTALTEIELPTTPFVFYDPTPAQLPRRFYRAVALTRLVRPAEDFVWCPPGSFQMGSPPTEEGRLDIEGPARRVSLSRGFLMARYEITQGQYEAVMGANPSFFKGDPNRPVERVRWFDAVNFCERLTARERAAGRLPQGYVYRLPTEAEWEYACRAGVTERFSWGSAADEATVKAYAWYDKNARANAWTSPHAETEGPQPVGTKLPNLWGSQPRGGGTTFQWGLHDMAGNVSEWCLDWEGPYSDGAVSDPQGPPAGAKRIVRGGNWSVEAAALRSAFRGSADPSSATADTGFRIVLGPVANPRLVWISPGTFTLGSPACVEHRDADESPQTLVTLTHGFWMNKYETTQGEYAALMANNPSMFQGDPNRPVENVRWDEALTYCDRLTERERAAGRLPPGHVYRLPTEVEWEYTCRAGTTTLFSFGLDPCFTGWTEYVTLMNEHAWTAHNSGTPAHPEGETHPVGLKQPNPWGLYDMHGNVWEQTLDWYGWYPGGSILYGPVSPPWKETWYTCLRGGAWHIAANECHNTDRHWRPHTNPATPSGSLGFRYVLAPTSP